ncbi:Os01g0137300 [Oryza sativa Japonica Group]|uniref:Os01g0137300 protein n=2 Tax=Oryza sativa subsp. japonica TaxID=39947 RepID=C7IW78_ORYSJ|nr:Os01g0137350 [Oryza sativa Japonica Group]BAS70282.1 Os01g0137300 [Oryza sativa Japonica Group]|eukprot:NP_001172167.1 Os01g0137350 [Oryza sativa Japonica Group]
MMLSLLPPNTCIFLELGIRTILLISECYFHFCCESCCIGDSTIFAPFYAISAHKHMERAGLQLLVSKLRKKREVIFFFKIISRIIDINILIFF